MKGLLCQGQPLRGSPSQPLLPGGKGCPASSTCQGSLWGTPGFLSRYSLTPPEAAARTKDGGIGGSSSWASAAGHSKVVPVAEPQPSAALSRTPSGPGIGRAGHLPELLPGSPWPPAGALGLRAASRRPQSALRQRRHEPGGA
jgi:hypothetical protein